MSGARLRLLVLCAGLAPVASATTLYAFGTDELFARAALVAVLEVREVRTVRAGGRLSTVATAEITRALKGGKPGARVEVVVPGGVLGDWVQRVDGAPALEPGETCVAFLEDAGGGAYGFVGLSQGRLAIDLLGGDWVVRREPGARLVRRVDGRLVDVPAPPVVEPLLPLLRRLEDLAGAGR